MAWQDMQKAMKLLAAMTELGKEESQKKGGWQGAAKGKGNQKGGPSHEGNKSWCMWKTCKAGQQMRPTIGGKCNCFSCGQHFSKRPPAEMLADWAFEAELKEAGKNNNDNKSKGKGKGKAAPTAAAENTEDKDQLAALRQERLAALKEAAKPGTADAKASASGSAGSSPQQASSAAAPAQNNKAAKQKQGSILDPGALESAPMIAALIQPIIDSVAADWVAEVPTDLNPDLTLAALLNNSDHLSTADGKEVLEACLAESRTLMASATSPAIKKCLSEQIKEDTAALDRLTKKGSPSLATQLAALQEAEKALLRQTSERKDKEAAGRRKAEARIETRLTFFKDVRAELAIIEQAMQSHEAQWEAIHAAKSQTLDGHERTVLARLQSKIVAAESPDTASEAPSELTAAESHAEGADKDAEMKNLQDTLTVFQKKAQKQVTEAKALAEAAAKTAAEEQAALMQQIKNLQAEATQAEALKQQTLASQQADAVFTEADFAMIPTNVAPPTDGGEKAFWKICGHLYQLLERWNFGGAIPVTIAELSAHSLAKDATQGLLRKLLGNQLWKGWFGTNDCVIAEGSILPRQLMFFLYHALLQLKDHYLSIEDTKAAAGKSYALLLEAASKKRRTLA